MVVVLISLRYLRSRLRQSLMTVSGVAMGVMILVFFQSLMGGFRGNFTKLAIEASAHITVKARSTSQQDPATPTRDSFVGQVTNLPHIALARPPIPDEKHEIKNWRSIAERARRIANVVAVAPFVATQAVMNYGDKVEAVNVIGVEPILQVNVIPWREKIVGGSPESLQQDPNGVILGFYLAEKLGLNVGDRVPVVTQAGATFPMKVVGLYRSRIYEVDDTRAYVNLNRAQVFEGLSGTVNGLYVRVAQIDDADDAAVALERQFGLVADSWREANQNFLSLITMITSIMYTVVVLTMTVAGFGIAGTLIMTVNEKMKDIGVLKALGVPPRAIAAVFVLTGMMTGLIGIAIGMMGGYTLIEIMSLVPINVGGSGSMLEADRFLMIRSVMHYVLAGVFAFVVSVFASAIPALRASRLDPLPIIRGAG
jgi:lipoprotein-releasing system permease protein